MHDVYACACMVYIYICLYMLTERRDNSCSGNAYVHSYIHTYKVFQYIQFNTYIHKNFRRTMKYIHAYDHSIYHIHTPMHTYMHCAEMDALAMRIPYTHIHTYIGTYIHT